MKLKKYTCILLIIIFILNICGISFAQSVENIQENNDTKVNLDTNDINDLISQRDVIQDKIEEVDLEIEYVQNEMSNTLLEIQKLDDKIREYEKQNNDFIGKLQVLNKSIEETTENLKVVTEDYNNKDKLLRERLSTFYEVGTISYIDVLLASKSLSDFISRYYMIKELIEYDNELMDAVEKEKNEIELAKQKLENETLEIKALKAKAEQLEIIYRNTKTLQQGHIENLSSKEKELNDKISKYKDETTQLENKIREISIANGEFIIQNAGGKMIWPVAIRGTAITSYYGTREHPIDGIVKSHQGIDIGNVGYGAPTVATLEGVVTYAGELGSYGNCVMIYHGEGITTLYGHGQKVLVKIGDSVKQGDVIMETGSTGNSTGPHLHFEVRIDGTTTNPLNYVSIPKI